MAYERDTGGASSRDDSFNRGYGSDYGAGLGGYSSARDYEAAGVIGPGGDRGRDQARQSYGARDYGNQWYGQRDQFGRGDRDQSGRDRYQGDRDYHGSYASDGRRFEDVGRYRHADDDDRARRERSYGRQPQGHADEDRGFFQRAGDEVRSWFGDDDAERRRDMDSRHDERSAGGRSYAGGRHDEDYHGWRSSQIAALDRDYDEYRRENRSRFESEFASWRSNRQTQRDALNRVKEHQEVVGSDGAHVGTVDKVKGDRILLTKNDADAGGQHHSIPSSWITKVEDKVTLSKTAAEAQQAWREEDRSSAMFNYGDNAKGSSDDRGEESKRGLNRSFSGTY